MQWGTVSGGPYPNVVNVGLPCTPGTQVACGDGGTVDQLDCAYTLTGITNGPWYFTATAYNIDGATSGPSNQASGTVACPCNGCSCGSGADCPPFQMCDPSTGMCDTNCAGSGCACVSDSQCAGGYTEQAGLGQGQICVSGFCVAGCNAATDCPLDLACDLSSGAPGSCVGGCTGSACACVIDTQCNADDEGQQSVCGENGFCTTGCKTGFDCPHDLACDQSLGFIASCKNPCTSGLCSCLFDSQCTDGGGGLGITCLESSGLCGPGCATGADCGDDQACNTSTNACSSSCAADPTQCACSTNSQCNGGQTGQGVVCNNALCVTGCDTNSDCASGTCNTSTTPGSCQ